jgi:hypothetical protein
MTQQGSENPEHADLRFLVSYWRQYLGSNLNKRKEKYLKDVQQMYVTIEEEC